MRAALLADDDRAVNVVEMPDDFTGNTWDGWRVQPTVPASVSPGDLSTAQTWIPLSRAGALDVSPASIPPDGITETEVTYRVGLDEPLNTTVTFVVDGQTIDRICTQGTASITVAADRAGEIEVRCGDAVEGIVVEDGA